MKHIISLLFFFIILSVKSQTLTQSFNEPVVGDVDKNYRLDTSFYTNGLPVATSGSNCVWNYTGLTGAFPVIVDSFISPVGAPGASAYPNATFVQHRDPIYSFFKSTASPQQTEMLGAYSPSLSFTFSNTAIIAAYPVSYGYNLTDPVSGTFKYNTTNGACNGNIKISAPGLGTINFAGGISISNVLCLKSVEILTLSVGPTPVGTFSQTIYNYYMPGRKFPVLNINYTTYQMIAGTPTITAYIYGSNNYFTVVGLNESPQLKENMRVYPNPFHDRLYLSAEDSKQINTYYFHDLNGRMISQTKSLTDKEIENLVPGIYFLEIRNQSGTFHQKIIKQ